MSNSPGGLRGVDAVDELVASAVAEFAERGAVSFRTVSPAVARERLRVSLRRSGFRFRTHTVVFSDGSGLVAAQEPGGRFDLWLASTSGQEFLREQMGVPFGG